MRLFTVDIDYGLFIRDAPSDIQGGGLLIRSAPLDIQGGGLFISGALRSRGYLENRFPTNSLWF